MAGFTGLRPHAAGPLGLEMRLRSGEVARCIGELRLSSGEVAMASGGFRGHRRPGGPPGQNRPKCGLLRPFLEPFWESFWELKTLIFLAQMHVFNGFVESRLWLSSAPQEDPRAAPQRGLRRPKLEKIEVLALGGPNEA